MESCLEVNIGVRILHYNYVTVKDTFVFNPLLWQVGHEFSIENTLST